MIFVNRLIEVWWKNRIPPLSLATIIQTSAHTCGLGKPLDRVGSGFEEYLVVADAAGYDPAFPVLEGYRMTMEYAPDLKPDHAGWYLVGIKGEILK